jgi:hypothetical protein
VVYEARGSVDPAVLAGGVAVVRDAEARWRIPVALLDADPGDAGAWLAAAREAVQGLLAGR